MQNISIFGLSARIVASATFPNGFTVTEFSTDADPLDSPEFKVADTAMGPNGHFLVWSRPNAMELSINVIPGSQADINLNTLLMANKVGPGKQSARDQVGMVISYPDGEKATMSEGVITSGNLIKLGTSEGKLKTRQYRFEFSTATKSLTTS